MIEVLQMMAVVEVRVELGVVVRLGTVVMMTKALAFDGDYQKCLEHHEFLSVRIVI